MGPWSRSRRKEALDGTITYCSIICRDLHLAEPIFLCEKPVFNSGLRAEKVSQLKTVRTRNK